MSVFGKLFGGTDKGGKMGDLLRMLTNDLMLSPEQVNKIQTYFHAFKEKRKAIKAGGGEREEIKAARQEMIQNMKAELTEVQKQTFENNREKYSKFLHES